jgi:GntR family transcriptional activator of glc operon
MDASGKIPDIDRVPRGNSRGHRVNVRQQIDKHHRQIYNAVISRQAQKAATAHVHHVCDSVREIETQEHGIIRDAIEEPSPD